MTNAEVLDLIMARLGNRTSTTLRATVLVEMNAKILELERGPYKPWFLCAETTESDTPMVVNQNYIALPSNFLMEIEEAEFRVSIEDEYTPLHKVAYKQLILETENEDAGPPEGYALFGDRIYLGPKPDLAYAYKFPHYAKTTAVVDNATAISNKWLLEFLNFITLETVMQVASLHTKSADVMQKTSVPLKAAQDAFRREVEAREHTNRTYLVDDEE